jgi:methionyl-tRNA synthetase
VIKTDTVAVNETLYVCANLLAKISVAMLPILPKHMVQLRQMLGLDAKPCFAEAYKLLGDITLGETKPLFHKLEDAQIEAQIAKLHAMAKVAVEVPSAIGITADKMSAATVKDSITYDDFAKLDIRLAVVLEAEAVPKTDKLLKLKVDLGFEQRVLVAGIAQSYAPQDFIGKTVTMLVNLEPRKIRGIESNGMILAAHSNDKIMALCPDGDGSPGSVVQ